MTVTTEPGTPTVAALHGFFRALAARHATITILGGAVEPTALNRWVILGLGERQRIELRGTQLTLNGQVETLAAVPEGASRLFKTLEEARGRCQTWQVERGAAKLPMAGGLVGCFGYEFYRWCDPGWYPAHAGTIRAAGSGKPVQPGQQDLAHALDETTWPELILIEHEEWLFIDLQAKQCTVLSPDADRRMAYQAEWEAWRTSLEGSEAAYFEGLEDNSRSETVDAETLSAYREGFAASFSPEGFAGAVEALRADIRAGEIYQANLSIRLRKQVTLDPLTLFERLCRRNPSPFAGFFRWPGGVVVCNSPERLVQATAEGLLQTRPIAGTRGRGKTAAEETAIGQVLLSDEKERAEHLMLADLARNDLGRVSAAGSVQVDELLVLERYAHVTHLVSNVQGHLAPGQNGWDVIKAVFPGGTITGVPKIRCVEILNRMEPVPRGFYTGALGYLDAASGALDLNILIRSLYLAGTDQPLVYNADVHVGAGIVHDAVGAHEYRECLRKAQSSLVELYHLDGTGRAQES